MDNLGDDTGPARFTRGDNASKAERRAARRSVDLASRRTIPPVCRLDHPEV
jgi:hypothetical protein